MSTKAPAKTSSKAPAKAPAKTSSKAPAKAPAKAPVKEAPVKEAPVKEEKAPAKEAPVKEAKKKDLKLEGSNADGSFKPITFGKKDVSARLSQRLGMTHGVAETMVDNVLAIVEEIAQGLRYEVSADNQKLIADRLLILGFLGVQPALRKAKNGWDNFSKKKISLPAKVYIKAKAGKNLVGDIVELKAPKKSKAPVEAPAESQDEAPAKAPTKKTSKTTKK
jgi:hypothetical protein